MSTLYGADVVTVRYGDRELHFDPITHTYHLDQQPLLGTTQYLQQAGYQHGWHGDGSKALFGRYVHEATAWDDAGELVLDTVDPLILVRLEAWRAFKREERFVPDLTLRERPIFHPIYLYAGIADAPGRLKDQPCIVEIKTGEPERWHALQVGGGYAPMIAAHFPQYQGATSMIVYLKDDGNYDMVKVTDKRLPMLFASIVACVNGREWYGSNGK